MYIIFGYIASCLFSILFLPQLIKIINTKQVYNISYIFITINIAANSCNIVFALGLWYEGLAKQSLPILSGCSIAFIWSVLLLLLKIVYTRKYKKHNNYNTHFPPTVEGKKNLNVNEDKDFQGE